MVIDAYEMLRSGCPEIELRTAEPMSRHCTFRTGGAAAIMAFPKDEQQLAKLLQFSNTNSIKRLILGAGSNILPPDEGLDALVICLRDGLTTLRLCDDGIIEVGAGISMARAAGFACEQGLSGLEFAHGIPGTVGGGIYMNAGAYGGEMQQVAIETTVMDNHGELQIYRGDAQGFSYRHSAFEEMDCVILRTKFQLKPAKRTEIQETMQSLAQRRRASQPLNLPSAGSTFKRPAGGYAAALIDEAGLKGLRVGGAVVSEKHAGFVVNDGGATSADILELIARIQARVYEAAGIRLEPEVRIL